MKRKEIARIKENFVFFFNLSNFAIKNSSEINIFFVGSANYEVEENDKNF